MNLIGTILCQNSALRGEKSATLLWYFIWGYAFFGELLSAFSAKLRLMDLSMPVANYVVTICLILCSIPYLNRKVKPADLAFWLLYCLLFALSYLCHPQNNRIQEEYAVETMLFTYPYLFLGLNINLGYMRKPMARISFMVILWYVFYCMIYQQNKIGSMQDNGVYANMHFAYLVLPHLLMCVWDTFKDKDIVSILGSILGIFLLLSLGNRGSLIDVVFFILAYMLFFVKTKRKYWAYFFTIVVGVVIYFYMNVIILFFQGIFSELGMSARIFDVLADNSFMIGNSVDERNLFLEKLLPAIKEGSLFGYGFCGSWQFIGSYPHNLFYDLVITFGFIGGILISLFLARLVYKAFRSTSNADEKAFLLLLVTTGFVKLFISYTFLNNVESFLMIGYCILLIRKKKAMLENER